MQYAATSTPACPADLKYSNRMQIIQQFFDGGTYSANDISAAIGLSRQTIMKSIQFFLRTGFLVSAGKGGSTCVGGKRPELFTLSPHKYFLCITMWPQDIRLHLYTIGSHLIDQIILNTSLPENIKEGTDHIGKLAQQLLAKHQVSFENLCAVSVSTAGTIDYSTGCLKYSSQSPSWGTDVPLAEYLRPYFRPDIKIFVENAAKMTARPFLLEPELKEKRVMVIFGCWGLSSCFIENGQILGGKNSLIGEIGHMVIAPDDPEPCGCGSKGCLERLVSVERARCLLQKEGEKFPESILLRRGKEHVTLRQLFEASENCDILARRVVEHLAHTFAVAIRNICLVFDPDTIVFQGDYAYADTFFDVQMKKKLREFQYFPSDSPFDILYDRRPLDYMNAVGSLTALIRQFFDDPALYQEPAAEA